MVYVVDAIMGAGKTSAAINYINSTSDEQKILYVTPYKSEAKRIMECCPEKHFYLPNSVKEQDDSYDDGRSEKRATTKMNDLKRLLNRGVNISTTHALFHHFDDETISLCYLQGYTLIMDEVANVVEEYGQYEPPDIELLKKNLWDIQDDGTVKWREDQMDYEGKFTTAKIDTQNGCLVYYQDKVMIWMFPIRVFEAFRDTFILTYMFDAQLQRYYYDYNGVEYKHLYVKGDNPSNYEFTDTPQIYKAKYNYKELINVVDDRKLNEIGDKWNFLSWSWYKTNKNNPVILGIVNKNMKNFFRNKNTMWQDGKYVKCDSEKAFWTTFKPFKKQVGKGTGVIKSWCACMTRATNEWQDRTVIAYMVNRFVRPAIVGFFAKYDITVDEDGYALSEMLQFIWRSAIRKGEHITVYIPSKRMRELLLGWIEENSRKDDNNEK